MDVRGGQVKVIRFLTLLNKKVYTNATEAEKCSDSNKSGRGFVELYCFGIMV